MRRARPTPTAFCAAGADTLSFSSTSSAAGAGDEEEEQEQQEVEEKEEDFGFNEILAAMTNLRSAPGDAMPAAQEGVPVVLGDNTVGGGSAPDDTQKASWAPSVKQLKIFTPLLCLPPSC